MGFIIHDVTLAISRGTDLKVYLILSSKSSSRLRDFRDIVVSL